ncbi:hypothetical protein B566_EDAN015089, partial [Ephemera danica]
MLLNFSNCAFRSQSRDRPKNNKSHVKGQKLNVINSTIQNESPKGTTELFEETTKGDEYVLYRYRRQDEPTEANEETEEPATGGGEGTTIAAPQVTGKATTAGSAVTTADPAATTANPGAITTKQPETGGATTTVLTTKAEDTTTAAEVVTTKAAVTTIQTTKAAEVTTKSVETTPEGAETTKKPDPEFPVTDPPVGSTTTAETSKATDPATQAPTTTTTLDPNDLEPGVVPGQICTTKLFK